MSERALQCAYCTPGFVLSVKALLDEIPIRRTKRFANTCPKPLPLCWLRGYPARGPASSTAAQRKSRDAAEIAVNFSQNSRRLRRLSPLILGTIRLFHGETNLSSNGSNCSTSPKLVMINGPA